MRDNKAMPKQTRNGKNKETEMNHMHPTIAKYLAPYMPPASIDWQSKQADGLYFGKACRESLLCLDCSGSGEGCNDGAVCRACKGLGEVEVLL